MILLTHIVIALSSVIFTAFTYFVPSKVKLRASQGLVAATLVSGTYLVVSTKAHLVSTCVVGLVYTGAVVAAMVMARNRLALEGSSSKN